MLAPSLALKVEGERMMPVLHSVRALALLSAAFVSGAPVAMAQTIQPPLVNALDENNVLVASQGGEIQLPDIDISIGDESSGLARVKLGKYADNFSNSIFVMPGMGGSTSGQVNARVSLLGKNYQFSVGNWYDHPDAQAYNPGPYMQIAGSATLTCTTQALRSLQGSCTLWTGDGTSATYDLSLGSGITNYHTSPIAYATSITKQDGEVLTISNSQPGGTVNSVSSSLGWMMKYQYLSDGSLTVEMYNTSVEYCPLATTTCSVSYSHPVGILAKNGLNGSISKNGAAVASYSVVAGSSTTLTTPGGVATLYQSTGTQVGSGSTISNFTVTKGGSTWQYRVETPEVVVQTQYTRGINSRTNPDGSSRSWKVDFNDHIYTYTDEGGRTTGYAFPQVLGSPGNVSRITRPGGDASGGYADYVYNGNFDVTDEAIYPRGGGNPIVRKVEYNCVVQVCRNKPTRFIDARGNATDFEYDQVRGWILKETGPPDVNGVRPQKRYTYTPLYPKVRDVSGALVNSTPVYRVTSISSCRIATAADPASCVGTANEIVTTYAYGTNNLQKTSETVAAGDGSVSATTSYTYNNWGAVTSVDGPRTDVDDKSYKTYDPQGRVIFEIGPDPDGAAGALKRLIIKHNYDADWRDYLVQTGYGNATDGSDFVATQFKRNIYSPTTGLVVRIEEGRP